MPRRLPSLWLNERLARVLRDRCRFGFLGLVLVEAIFMNMGNKMLLWWLIWSNAIHWMSVASLQE